MWLRCQAELKGKSIDGVRVALPGALGSACRDVIILCGVIIADCGIDLIPTKTKCIRGALRRSVQRRTGGPDDAAIIVADSLCAKKRLSTKQKKFYKICISHCGSLSAFLLMHVLASVLRECFVTLGALIRLLS